MAAVANEVQETQTVVAGEPVSLMTQDGTPFTLDREIAFRSVTIRNMVEDVGEEMEHIPLPNIDARIFSRIIEYLEHYRGKPVPEENEEEDRQDGGRDSNLDEWEQNFFQWTDDFTQSDNLELILAANYLDIKQLLDSSCKAIANEIKGQSPEQIRQKFNIKNDFTPEEEEAARKDNEWATGE